jgi:hypothetical protein
MIVATSGSMPIRTIPADASVRRPQGRGYIRGAVLPDFTKLPYGFDEFPPARSADWQKAAAGIAPWQSPEGIAHPPC